MAGLCEGGNEPPDVDSRVECQNLDDDDDDDDGDGGGCGDIGNTDKDADIVNDVSDYDIVDNGNADYTYGDVDIVNLMSNDIDDTHGIGDSDTCVTEDTYEMILRRILVILIR
ncbi:hypothetical protein ANN_06255 [Periplaneta americana]|uniref:Uncharacterized protein n=1 Tax=Periplaneta americana TaxID=6978 RepID=A0ABQ8TD22_PERAM|nr:hypothetical protein ANN_06255 [Periplaneta americana]